MEYSLKGIVSTPSEHIRRYVLRLGSGLFRLWRKFLRFHPICNPALLRDGPKRFRQALYH